MKATKEDKRFWNSIKNLPIKKKMNMASLKWGTGFGQVKWDIGEDNICPKCLGRNGCMCPLKQKENK